MGIGRPHAQWAAHRAGREKYIFPWAESGVPLQRHKLLGWATHFLMGFTYVSSVMGYVFTSCSKLSSIPVQFKLGFS